MALFGSPLGRRAPTTPSETSTVGCSSSSPQPRQNSNDNSHHHRRDSLYRTLSASNAASSRTSKLLFSRSSSVISSRERKGTVVEDNEEEVKEDEPASMKFPAASKLSHAGPRDFFAKRRQPRRIDGSGEGAAIKTAATVGVTPPQISKVRPLNRKRSVVNPEPRALARRSSHAEAALSQLSGMAHDVDAAPEVHPDFLGVGNDGTVHWAQDTGSGARSRAASDPRCPIEAPFVLEQKTRGPTVSVAMSAAPRSVPVSRPDVAPAGVEEPEADRPQSDSPQSDSPQSDRPQSVSTEHSAGSSLVSSNNSTIRQSVMSFAVAEMPSRGFSIASSTVMGDGLMFSQADIAPDLSSSSLSASSDEHFDDDASSTYSRRSSMSSATMEVAHKPGPSRRGSTAYSILSPATAGVYDELPPTPRAVRPKISAASLGDLSNKPLPPEPLEMAPAPLSIAPRPHPRQTFYKSGSPLSSSSLSPPSEASSSLRTPPRIRSRMSLKSKYSSSDLDAIDKAFQRASPSTEQSTLLEAQEALELQLSTIAEDAAADELPFDWDEVPKVYTPLQIARGPMEMAPSRAPPPHPPERSESMPLPKPESQENRNARNHVVSQLRSPSRQAALVPRPPEARLDGHRSKWSQRAHKVLSRYQPGPETRVSALESPSTLRTLPTTPNTVAPATPGSPASPDPAVLEINKRLELLKMKERSEAFRMEAFRLADKREESQVSKLSDAAEALRTSFYRAPSVVVPPRKEGDAAARRGRAGASGVPSLVSLTVSDLPEWYADMSASAEQLATSQTAARPEEERDISAEAAETVLLNILQSLTTLQDLFSATVVSKGFYRTYKRNELPLMRNALKSMSPAAWELRETSPPFEDGNELNCDRPVPDYTPRTYLRYYTRDMYIMVALKSLILVRCESFLRPETVAALSGNDDRRSLQLDDAFWRVWTFCKIFGSNKNREDDLVGQMDWLRGGLIAHQATCSSTLATTDPALGMSSALLNPSEAFGLGNGKGLTPNELWDMTEIWTCLGVLVQGFHGKRDLARRYGIFDGQGVLERGADREDAVLEQWVAYILTLGPSVILDLATPSDQPGPQGFAMAAENGWTEWEAPLDGSSRSTFLKDAVTRVYEEKMSALRIPERSHSRNISVRSSIVRGARHPADVIRARQSPEPSSAAEERRPLSYETEAPMLPRKASPRGAKLPLASSHSPRDRPRSPDSGRQQVHDPVDKAVWKLVGMGFPADKAKKALAETDTGENLNVEAAVQLCLLWTEKRPVQGLGVRV
ncbi:MAG: hypothetical protein M1832_002425 [Thelocarpon impressellum]|nr:MAG: hypothetical protein M1832_002425 [Thelocarpon impressellum]